jgi:hypothetical protein
MSTHSSIAEQHRPVTASDVHAVIHLVRDDLASDAVQALGMRKTISFGVHGAPIDVLRELAASDPAWRVRRHDNYWSATLDLDPMTHVFVATEHEPRNRVDGVSDRDALLEVAA